MGGVHSGLGRGMQTAGRSMHMGSEEKLAVGSQPLGLGDQGGGLIGAWLLAEHRHGSQQVSEA